MGTGVVRHRSKDLGEDIWRHGQAKWKSTELVAVVVNPEPEELAICWSILQIQGASPHSRNSSPDDGSSGLRFEARSIHVLVECTPVDDRLPLPLSWEPGTVGCRSLGYWFDGSFFIEDVHLSMKLLEK